jgi:hypothetical protein
MARPVITLKRPALSPMAAAAAAELGLFATPKIPRSQPPPPQKQLPPLNGEDKVVAKEQLQALSTFQLLGEHVEQFSTILSTTKADQNLLKERKKLCALLEGIVHNHPRTECASLVHCRMFEGVIDDLYENARALEHNSRSMKKATKMLESIEMVCSERGLSPDN